MDKRKSETTEYSPEWDCGTYQTGSAKPHKERRGLIALLMILVIFLGGIASAMGILNIRLLQKLAETNAGAQEIPLQVDGSQGNVPVGKADDQDAPSLPTSDDWNLPLETAQQTNLPAEEILQRNAQALVSIHCEDPDAAAVACGVILDESGYLVTNAYPIYGFSHIYVTLSDGRCFRASVVGSDEFTDLAVLYVDAPGLAAAQFADGSDLSAGDSLVFIGADRAAREGRLTGTTDAYAIGDDQVWLLQTDFDPICGPVFNRCGQIVGFGSSFLGTGDMSLALPMWEVKHIVEQIIETGAIHGRPCLGAEMEEVGELHQQYWHLPQGLRVARTFPNGTQLGGLEPGDILISLNGMEITDRESLCAILRQLNFGQQVTATVIRGQETITLTLTIQASGEKE